MATHSRMEAGRWFIILFVYMTLISFVLTMFNYFTATYSVGYNTSISGGFDGFNTNLQTGSCYLPSDAPSYLTDYNIPKDTLVTRSWLEYDKCPSLKFYSLDSQGVNLKDGCNNIAGCNYVTNSTGDFLWFQYDIPAYCNGTINYSAYGINTSDWDYSNKTGNFCYNDGIVYNMTNCLTFGCIWVKSNQKSVESTAGFFTTLTSTIWDMLSFNLDIGLSDIFLVLFTTLFVWLPVIMICILGYVLVVG